LSYRNLLATMEKACEGAGVEHRGPHVLRHSFASNLYARGVEVKIISNRSVPAWRSPTTGISISLRARLTIRSGRRSGRKCGTRKVGRIEKK
jgi:hypothetical protein